MSRPDDESDTDSAWREIVANYGERAPLTPDEPSPEPPAPEPRPDVDEADSYDDLAEVGRFRPPPVPPLPRPRTWQRGVAWAGVLAVPALALVLTLIQVSLPSVLAWGMAAWCLASFVYLAVLAPRAPRDPWDDGSRV